MARPISWGSAFETRRVSIHGGLDGGDPGYNLAVPLYMLPAGLALPGSGDTLEVNMKAWLARELRVDWHRRSLWLVLWFVLMLAALLIISNVS